MDNIKKAVIVAAGCSSRLYPLTIGMPKGLLQIQNESMLSRSVRLLRNEGVEEIAVVVGYCRELIQDHLGSGIEYIFNPFFATTNNMASLWFARHWMGDDPFLYLHSDLVYAPELLTVLLKNDAMASFLVDTGPVDEEAMKVRAQDGWLIESNKQIKLDEASGEWIGITLFRDSIGLFDRIESLLEYEENFNAYDTLAFTEMVKDGVQYAIVATEKYPWIEVDDQDDLERAKGIVW